MSAREEPPPPPQDDIERHLDAMGLGDDDAWIDHARRATAHESQERLGPYEILSEHARGAQSVVYRARRQGSQDIVALKRLHTGIFSTDATQRRLHREVHALSVLDHPRIVPLLDVESLLGHPVITMPWIEGVDLRRYVREHHPQRDLQTILPLVLEIARAVHHAHTHGIIHRDLKPDNILADDEGNPHLLDFGLAKLMRSEFEGNLTLTDQFVGTPSYAAPEQLRRACDATERSDIYSLGAILYELLTGGVPIELSHDAREWIRKVELERPTPLGTSRPDLPKDLTVVINRALHKDPAQRYPSVEEFGSDLLKCLHEQPIEARAPGLLDSCRETRRRHPLAFAIAVVVFVSLTLFGLGSAIYEFEVRRARDRAKNAEHAAQNRHGEALRAAREVAEATAERQNQAIRADTMLRFLVERVLGSERLQTMASEEPFRDILDDAALKVESRGLDGAASHESLARAYRALSVLDAAREHAQRALALYIEALGPRDPETAAVRALLGDILGLQKSWEQGEGHLEEALRVQRDRARDRPEDLAESLHALARICSHRGFEARAAALRQEASAVLSEGSSSVQD